MSLFSDDTFTYTAASQSIPFGQFGVQASDSTTITVKPVLAVNPSVPTFGEVALGDTGNGGPVEDARDPGSTTPNDDDGDTGSDEDDDDEGPVEVR